jgi:hypothetical protein
MLVRVRGRIPLDNYTIHLMREDHEPWCQALSGGSCTCDPGTDGCEDYFREVDHFCLVDDAVQALESSGVARDYWNDMKVTSYDVAELWRWFHVAEAAEMYVVGDIGPLGFHSLAGKVSLFLSLAEKVSLLPGDENELSLPLPHSEKGGGERESGDDA